MKKFFTFLSTMIMCAGMTILVGGCATPNQTAESNLCVHDGCTKERYNSETNFCFEHKCSVDECNYGKQGIGNYCFLHTCEVYGCINYAEDEFCDEHRCQESGCELRAQSLNGYCYRHFDITTRLNPFGMSLSYVNEDTGFFSFYFYFYNNTDKEIEQVHFVATIQNKYGEKIKDRLTGQSSYDIKIQRYVAPGELCKYEDNLGWAYYLGRISVNEITVDYSDGTSETGRFGYYVSISN